ncbi:MAG TPA: hypothetical protein VF584_21285 [Longimicrobium sp.]|jgi:hypothetical protein
MINSSHPMNAVSAALVLCMSPILLLLGIVGSLADTGEMRGVFIMMAFAGLVLLLSGIHMLVKWRRAVVDETAHQNAIRAAVGSRPTAPAPPHAPQTAPAVAARPGAVAPDPVPLTLPSGERVLAHWVYEPGEWSGYTTAEVKRRKGEWVGGTIVIMVAGLVSSSGGGQEGRTMLMATAILAVIILVGGMLMAKGDHQANVSGPGEAIITPSAIMLNGRYHVLRNDTYRFQGVRFDEAATPPQLEFTIGWSTRSGPARDNIRIPVPAGREEEAREVVALFSRR